MTIVRDLVQPLVRDTVRSISGGETDPFFSSVVFLGHFDGADGQTSAIDSSNSAHAIAFNNNAELDTSNPQFGSAALFEPAGDAYASLVSDVDFQYGTGDFTVEISANGSLWPGGTHIIYEQRILNSDIVPVIYHSGKTLFYFTNNANRITAAAVLTDNVYERITISKKAGNTRMFLNGTQVGSTYVDANNYIQSPVILGQGGSSLNDPLFGFTGLIDEVRITKGVGRYDSNYTPATGPFPNS